MTTTQQIMRLLNVDEETALKVRMTMGELGLDFSECTQEEFDAAAREAYDVIEHNGRAPTLDLLAAAEDAYEADFGQVALRLQSTGLDANVHASGGGVDVVLVRAGGYDLYFGTADILWGASVYKKDGDYTGTEIKTQVPADETNPDKVATGIAAAIHDFLKNSPR